MTIFERRFPSPILPSYTVKGLSTHNSEAISKYYVQKAHLGKDNMGDYLLGGNLNISSLQ